MRDIYCSSEVLFDTCVAMKFVDDDDDEYMSFEPVCSQVQAEYTAWIMLSPVFHLALCTSRSQLLDD